jgi:PAS domain S-box-containing protein
MQKEFNIKVESRVVEEKILNFTSLVVALLSLPLVASSLLRINYTGIRFIYIFHVFVAIVMWSIFLLRGRVKFEVRIVLFIVVLMILILPSVPMFGIHDYWGYIAILYSFLAGLFFGKKWGLITVSYTFVCISITAYLFVFTTAITTDIHLEGNHNLYDFLYHGVLLLSVSLIIVFSINKYRDYFHLILNDLFVAKDNAEKHEHKYKQLSSLTFEGIMIHDNGIIIDVNQSFANMMGYSAEELIGKNLINSNIIPEKYHKLIYENMVKNYAYPYEVEGVKKDGTRWPVEIESRDVKSDDNTIIRVSAIRDISYRKKLENELKDSEYKFRKLFENSGDATLIIENEEFVNCNCLALCPC